MGDPDMMKHLGGPESEEQIVRRHQCYLRLPETGTASMFKLVWGPAFEAVGGIGFWERTWRDQLIYEMGWFVLPAYQGRGIATKGCRSCCCPSASGTETSIHACIPVVSNAASNAICRKLGFSLIEECDFEYPPGQLMRVNDWCLDLFEKKESRHQQTSHPAPSPRRAGLLTIASNQSTTLRWFFAVADASGRSASWIAEPFVPPGHNRAH